MVISQHPIRTTIFFGLICGLSFIPANLALSYLLHGASVINLTLWLYAAGYALLLSRWSKKPILSAGFPLLLLFCHVLSGGFHYCFLPSIFGGHQLDSHCDLFSKFRRGKTGGGIAALCFWRDPAGRVHPRFCNYLDAGYLDVLFDSIALFCDF